MQMLDMGNLNNQVPPGWQFGEKMMFSWRFKYSRRRINMIKLRQNLIEKFYESYTCHQFCSLCFGLRNGLAG